MSKIILDEKWRRIVESFDGSKETMLKETAKILRCFEISKQCEKGITKIFYGSAKLLDENNDEIIAVRLEEDHGNRIEVQENKKRLILYKPNSEVSKIFRFEDDRVELIKVDGNEGFEKDKKSFYTFQITGNDVKKLKKDNSKMPKLNAIQKSLELNEKIK